jgi:hypothetical protein
VERGAVKPAAALAGLSLLVTALVLAAGAGAARQGEYDGKVKGAPGSEITFKVDRRKGEKHVKVFRFEATGVPTDCGGSPDTTEYGLPGYFGLRIREGRFRIKDSPSGFRDDSLFVLHGRVKPGGRAKGTLRIVDDFDNIPTCSTGRVRWAASK